MTKKQVKKKGWLIGAVALVVVAGAAVPLFAANDTGAVKTEEVTEETITTYNSFTGTLTPDSRTLVSAERSDLFNIIVEEGQVVSEGDVLAEGEQGNIISPASGTVSGVKAESGQLMQGTPLMEIVDYTDLEASIQIDESDIGYVTEGGSVLIRISSMDEEVNGEISSIANEAVTNGSPSARAYFTAKVEIDETDNMRAGMTLEALTVREEVTDVPTLSLDGIEYDDQDQPFVWIENGEEGLTKRYIKLGITDGLRVQITEGLVSGDQIVIEENNADGGFAPPMMGGGGQ
ncbi:efflux RND transporter periplasmic adaptor subunit [Jeotgalibacillus salarius]|uniref:HlyD family efflux transporter periplasmic adaptor subunit n=1 Tax=Jeotgalibacillus salarius TaxID=546023 RepID=A0A4Y8LKU7_9BACL|nr:HlyD family efflux transporter periplasmic adaptor subunit [Jeotgalibacillus salarius]TFE02399.1 HlyD family efflux transporter periplasmic adaptor subunit [Jeotgalibacillus salarius]